MAARPPQMPSALAGEFSGYGTRDEKGAATDPSFATFPIVRYDEHAKVHLLGTGFFIAADGLFITARHGICDDSENACSPRYPIGIMQLLAGGGFVRRPIQRFTCFHLRLVWPLGRLPFWLQRLAGEMFLRTRSSSNSFPLSSQACGKVPGCGEPTFRPSCRGSRMPWKHRWFRRKHRPHLLNKLQNLRLHILSKRQSPYSTLPNRAAERRRQVDELADRHVNLSRFGR